MNIGEYIKRYIDEHEISQRQFAEKAGVTGGYINMLIKGKNPGTGKPVTPSYPVIAKIAKAMGMSVDALVRAVDDFEIDLQQGTPSEDEYAMQGISARVAVDTNETLKHQTARPSIPTIKSVIKQLEEIDKQNAVILAEDERKLIDAFRHMTTATQKRFLATMDQFRDF